MTAPPPAVHLGPAEARRIALGAQGFSRRRPEAPGARHVHAAMQRMGVLQIDSVNVFARSHYMPLLSRLGPYDPALLDRLFLGRASRYTEYLAHEATFMPVEDWPLWRFRRESFARRYAHEWTGSRGAVLARVRDALRAHGPSRPADLRDDAPRNRGPWWDWDDVKHALEHLWRTGEVAIAGRDGFERRYALAEHVVPARVLDRDLPVDEAVRELVRRGARAHGIATAADIADYHRLRRGDVQPAIDALVEAGELLPAQVRGWEQRGRPQRAWLHADAVRPRRIGAAALLTPFDPVVWFRDRALRVFELDYRIEIYTPAVQRRYGYYCLPVLVDDRIAARVDLKADRRAGVLRVQSAWWEPHARPAEDAPRIAAELRAAAGWQGLDDISVGRWGDAHDALHAELDVDGGAQRHGEERAS